MIADGFVASLQSATDCVKMVKTQKYLASGPLDLLNSCDVLLKLEDGTELPAHSQVLARCMPVFSGMVDGGPLSQASPANIITVPFGECSSEDAGRFLSAVYSFRAHEHIDEHSAVSVARLSHKYGVEVKMPAAEPPMYVRRPHTLSYPWQMLMSVFSAGPGEAVRRCPWREGWYQQQRREPSNLSEGAQDTTL